ncbi:response regulator transcription factor [Nigerium sp.]|uniref:response regulator transcription factor n=1 Tax=Nigerium sp. TaxID=2042655 RepID=UPI003221761C
MRVIVVEDSSILRAGLVRLLADAGHDVVADLVDASGLTAAVEGNAPDIVILDVRLPPTHTDEGIRAALDLRRRRPGLPVLVFSQYVEEHYATQLVASSRMGLGYLLKDRVTDVDEFLAALDAVAAGGTVLDPEVVAQLLVRTRNADVLDRLSPRERQVLGLMAEGRSNASIAGVLVITESSVEKHVSSVFTKLGLPPEESGNRRVMAVLTYLGHPTSTGPGQPAPTTPSTHPTHPLRPHERD